MAGAYVVTLAHESGQTKKSGVDAVVVWAEDAADAKAIAQAQQDGGASDAAWTAATVTAAAAGADMENWRLRVKILDSSPVIDVTVTGGSAADVDDLGDLMVIALNATSIIAGAAYSTPNLTIAETTDTLGDRAVEVEMLPPLDDADWEDPSVAIPGFVGAVTDEGAAGDALAVALVPGAAIPAVIARVKQ